MRWTSVCPLLRTPCLVFGLVVLLLVPAPALANPLPVTGACCGYCAECLVQSEYECLQQGDAYYCGDFTTCDPNPCTAPRVNYACCYPDGRCEMTDCARSCFLQGGSAMPAESCFPDPCLQTGVCCHVTGLCEILTEAACVEIWGGWMGPGYDSCEPNPCPPCLLPCSSDACCLTDGSCRLAWANACEAHDGAWQGPGSTCNPNPCVTSGLPEPEVELHITWGRVKNTYR